MSQHYEKVCEELRHNPKVWLVTGAAGFIGSHLTEKLLSLGQTVRGFDNFATGHKRNIEAVLKNVGPECAKNFTFIEGTLLDEKSLQEAVSGVSIILHQAALGSVSRSVEAPFPSHQANVTGFLMILEAARKNGVRSFVYASSSSVYGDSPTLPKREGEEGELLSPYAATKAFNETYAKLFTRLYGLKTVGLRYFNVFGARQDPAGEYAAVIPRWVEARAKGQPCKIFGDGETSRDFCYIDNVVQANLLAALNDEATGTAYNVACGERLTLKELYFLIDEACQPNARAEPEFHEFRKGDIRHSLADISKIQSELKYEPLVFAKEGLQRTVRYFLA